MLQQGIQRKLTNKPINTYQLYTMLRQYRIHDTTVQTLYNSLVGVRLDILLELRGTWPGIYHNTILKCRETQDYS